MLHHLAICKHTYRWQFPLADSFYFPLTSQKHFRIWAFTKISGRKHLFHLGRAIACALKRVCSKTHEAIKVQIHLDAKQEMIREGAPSDQGRFPAEDWRGQMCRKLFYLKRINEENPPVQFWRTAVVYTRLNAKCLIAFLLHIWWICFSESHFGSGAGC